MAGVVVVAERGEADSGEGGGGGEPPDDSAVGSVVRSGRNRGSGLAQAGQWGDASSVLDGGAGGTVEAGGIGREISDEWGSGAQAVRGGGSAFHAGGMVVYPGGSPSFTQMIKMLFGSD